MQVFRCLAILALVPLVPVFADSINIGYIANLSDSPTGGEQELAIYNLTGPANCQAGEYNACSNLNLTNWTLTVDYTSSYYTGTSVAYTDSGSGPYGGFGDITPSSTNNVFDLDLCGGAASCTDIDNPTTTITSVEFSGQISPSSICLYDASAGGCNGSNPTTFFGNPAFDLVWNGSSPQTPYVNEDNVAYAQSPDFAVTDQSSGVPEPSTFLLFVVLLPLARFARRSQSA
jgi:hypothetical protein